MKFEIHILCFQYVVLCNLYYTSKSVPIIAENVRPANPNEFPFVVSLSENDDAYDAELNHFCTGTLITKKHVLTSAHCFVENGIGDFHVVVGSHDLRSGKSYIPKTIYPYNIWALKHKKKPEFKNNDIAIVTLNAEIEENIEPAIISTATMSSLFGSTGIIAGWGGMKETETPRYLQTSNLMIISNAECENRVLAARGRKISYHERFFCTVAEPPVVLGCGDSGGPLLDSNNVLLGINRGVIPKPEETSFMNMHVGLNFYKDFIDEVVANH